MPILGSYVRKFLDDGWHDVEVARYELTTFNSGNAGVVFEIKSPTGGIDKVRFPFVANMFWKLAWFAEACGLSPEQMERFDTDQQPHLASLVGRRIRVLVETKEGESTPDFCKFDRSETTQANYVLPESGDDGIPF